MEGSPREFVKDHPSTALLIVEVAVSSLSHDRKKAGLYAKAGVPEYWIVDVKHRQVLVHRLPAPLSGRKFQHGYREVMTERDAGQVTPLITPPLVIPVRDLLP